MPGVAGVDGCLLPTAAPTLLGAGALPAGAADCAAPAVAVDGGRVDRHRRPPGEVGSGDGRPSVDEARERRDHRAGIRGDELGAQQHRAGVFLRVVVGEDRPVQVGGGSRRPQVARGGEDRIHGVHRVRVARVQGVDPVLKPGFRHELHPPHGARARHRQVAAVVRLDFVDGREDLPRHPVLHGGGLVDGKQEQRDAVEAEGLDRGLRGGERARLCRDHLRRERDVVRAGELHRRLVLVLGALAARRGLLFGVLARRRALVAL